MLANLIFALLVGNAAPQAPLAAAEEIAAVYEAYTPLAEAVGRANAEARQDRIVAQRFSGERGLPADIQARLNALEQDRRTRLLSILQAHDPVALLSRAPQTANFLTRLVRLNVDADLSSALMSRFEPLAGTPALHERVYQSLVERRLHEDDASGADQAVHPDPDALAAFERERAAHAGLVSALGEATGRDQFVRAVFVPKLAEMGADAGAFIEGFQPVISAVDAENAAYARDLLDDPGFAVLHAEAPDAAKRVVDLLHHGGTDVDKARLLDLIEPLALAGDFDGQTYAQMFDRLAESQGRPQRYGTQDACVEGRREIYRLENPETVDRRRTALGMMALEEYRAILIDLYGEAC